MNPAPRRYVLGADPDELQRLAHQHEVWRFLSDDVFDRLPVQAGWTVMDAGCGPGHVLKDLRQRVGAEGEVWGVDMSPVMLAEAQRRAEEHGWQNVRFVEGDLEKVELPQDKFDLVWLRWVLSFPPDPGALISRLASTLRPGGCLVVQDYNHDGVGLFPESDGFRAVIRATRQLYKDSGGDPWIGTRLPEFFRASGLQLENYQTDLVAGGPGEPVFDWADRFFPPWANKYLEQGLLSREEYDSFLADWEDRRKDEDARYFSPILVTATGRRPT